MKTLTQLVLSFFAASVLAFTLLATPGCNTPVNWPATVKCATPITGALVQQIEGILMNGGNGMTIGDAAIAALEKLARENGPELVSCIIEQFISNTMRPGGPELTTSKAAATARAQDFLNRKGITALSTQGQADAP